jgi:hypothetical protein
MSTLWPSTVFRATVLKNGIGVELTVLNPTLNPGPDRGSIGVVDSGVERNTPVDCSGFGVTVDLDVRG